MKICILIAHEEQLTQAGVRIRYRRIEQALGEQGHALQVVPIQDLVSHTDFEHDVYIVSKCYDARALLVGRMALARQKLFGVDLFDDYFTQVHDSRFVSQRHWLRALREVVQLALCSTTAMRDIAKSFAPKVAVHVMNDPAMQLDAEAVRAAVRRKFEFFEKTGIVNVGWFGIGDNPHFPVGLSDLAGFGDDLARLRASGLDVRLSILTNARAMTADGLTRLKRLAVPHILEEWTEERETRLLAKSLICFLPVNAQNFSTTKSLNRAVSALCAGAQVLSSGYPLYAPMGEFVYRDPMALVDTLKRKALALRGDTAPDLIRLLERLADPNAESRAFAAFLENQIARQPKTAAPVSPRLLSVIHGRRAMGQVHKFAQRKGVLSVSAPFCISNLNFDLRFVLSGEREGLDVLIAAQWCSTLSPNLQTRLSPHGEILDRTYLKLSAAEFPPHVRLRETALARMDSPMSIVASYPQVMASITGILQHLFPGISCDYAEDAELPWSVLPRIETRQRELVG